VHPIQTGLTLRKWRLEHRIGIGGHGEVWMATSSRGVQAALKIRPHTDDAQSTRFRKEFERLRTLRLPGVIRVLDTGVDQGYIYFAMELAQGLRWDRYLDSSRSIGERTRRTIDAGAGVARILASMNQLHLAHRDIKPANVHVQADLVEQTVQVTLLDFGTQRFGSLRDEDAGLQGTPAYMSPEQRLGMPHDTRTDCYSLGVMLYEAISQLPSHTHPVGRPRASLCRMGREVPLAVADLVERLLRLDPAARPTAAEAEAVLQAVTSGLPLEPAPWPRPISHTGDPAELLAGNGLVVGPPGSGRGRLINEARWQWYRRGYRSVAADCVPDEVFGAWHGILDELFREQDPELRRALAGESADVLRAVWPSLPVPVDSPLVHRPSPEQLATAIGLVLTRCQPCAIVLNDLEQADRGTQEVLKHLLENSPEELHIWGTSTSPVAGMPEVQPPPWDEATARASWEDLVPESEQPAELQESPVSGLAAAWRAFAIERQLPPPPSPMPDGLVRLSALGPTFPRSVAVRMVPELDELLSARHLQSIETKAEGSAPRIRFASAATRTLAQLQPGDRSALHGLALEAWSEEPGQPEVIRARAHHAFRANRVDGSLLADVIEVALNQGDPTEIRRWLELHRLHIGEISMEGSEQGFVLGYAQLLVDLMLHPSRVDTERLRGLAVCAETPLQRGMAAYLKLKHAAQSDDRERIAAEGRRWAKSLSNTHPSLAARMLRETALVHLSTGKMPSALRDSRQGLDLARRATLDEDELTDHGGSETSTTRLSQAEIDLAITHSAALVYSGAVDTAAELACDMARRCLQADHPRGAASFLTNQAIALHRSGQRALAADCVADARALYHRHQDPSVFANWAVIAARLALERGDLPAGTRLLDEAITAAQATQDNDLLAEAWTLSLDAACQSGSPEEAQRALSTYGTDQIWSARDHWPAALARWHWAVGDLDGALRATETARVGAGGAAVLAERARLQLVRGQPEQSAQTCREALDNEAIRASSDLSLFLKLVLGAAEAHHDGDYVILLSQTREQQWVHLYLGALHLDAVRRRRRGENVSAVLRQLDDRSADVDHALYRALSLASGW
jgi:hypothetical protein